MSNTEDAVNALALGYTEHAKLMAIRSESQAIGDFINDSGYVLAQYSEEAGELIATSKDINTILAEYFGLDQQKLEEEKRDMLEKMREGDGS